MPHRQYALGKTHQLLPPELLVNLEFGTEEANFVPVEGAEQNI